MTSKKVKIIINPRADFGHAWERTKDLYNVAAEFGGADFSCTAFPNHAKKLVLEAASQGYSLVIAAGGDGTVHEVVNGLMELPAEKRPHLGVVPLGSGNDFSFSLGISPDSSAALRQVLTGQSRRVDIGMVKDQNGRSEFFANALGVGFDATVTFYFRKITYLRGILAYLLAVIKTIVLHHNAPIMEVSTDNEQWKEESLMFVACNGSREGGGFLVTPQSKPDDGIIHYARVDKVSRLMMFRLIPEVMKGTHERFSQVHLGYFKRLDLTADRPLHIHMDGEVFSGFDSEITGIHIEILPGEIEVMT